MKGRVIMDKNLSVLAIPIYIALGFLPLWIMFGSKGVFFISMWLIVLFADPIFLFFASVSLIRNASYGVISLGVAMLAANAACIVIHHWNLKIALGREVEMYLLLWQMGMSTILVCVGIGILALVKMKRDEDEWPDFVRAKEKQGVKIGMTFEEWKRSGRQ
jgi:hypothetical protein